LRLYEQNAEQNHWTERGRATSVSNSNATGRPRRSVLPFAEGRNTMGDSGLTTMLAGMALLVIVLAVVLAVIAWRTRRRTVRIAIGATLLLLGVASAVLSIIGFVIVVGLGLAALIAGLKTAPTSAQGREVAR